MKPNRIILEYPLQWIDNNVDGNRNAKFFINVLNVIARKNIPISLRTVAFDTYDMPRNIKRDDIVFAWHSYIPFQNRETYNYNVFSLKEAPISPLYSIDFLGFSGWSSVTDINLYASEINNIYNYDEIIDSFKKKFIMQGESKYFQEKLENTEIPKTKYVFFPLQVQNDPVHNLSKLSAIDILYKASEIAKNKKILLVVKKHPFDTNWAINNTLSKIISTNEYVMISNGNIHKLNFYANSIISVNSGTSFEALIFDKCVFNSGLSEWYSIVNPINNLSDLEYAFEDKSNFHIPTDKKKILAFLLSKFWVKNDDKIEIEKKINKCFDLFISKNKVLNSDINIVDELQIQLMKAYKEIGLLKRQIDYLKLDKSQKF